jgi:hypothetical protein
VGRNAAGMKSRNTKRSDRREWIKVDEFFFTFHSSLMSVPSPLSHRVPSRHLPGCRAAYHFHTFYGNLSSTKDMLDSREDIA